MLRAHSDWADSDSAESVWVSVEPHLEAALAKGDCDGRRLWCPKHGFCFDLETGARLSPTPSQALGDRLRMRTVSFQEDWAGLRLRLSEDQ